MRRRRSRATDSTTPQAQQGGAVAPGGDAGALPTDALAYGSDAAHTRQLGAPKLNLDRMLPGEQATAVIPGASWSDQPATPAHPGAAWNAPQATHTAPSVSAVPGAPTAQPAEPEMTVLRLRRHGRHLTWPVLVLIAVAAAAGFFIGTFPELWQNLLAAVAAVVIAVFLGLGPILGWLTRRVVVTTRRIILRHGFFVRHRSEVSLARVREVRSRQNPWQRMWGAGNIELFVGTESTRLNDVPKVAEQHAAIQELAERSYDEQQRQLAYGATGGVGPAGGYGAAGSGFGQGAGFGA